MKKIINTLLFISLLFCFYSNIIFAETEIIVLAEENYTDFMGGDGSDSNPYKVSTPIHLKNVSKYLGKHFIQVNDIDMSKNGNFSPIGSIFNEGFKGTYDGNGYKIIGLKVYDYVNGGWNSVDAGLFGYVNGGMIKNLGMQDCNIKGSIIKGGKCSVGGIVGSIKDGTIINCYNQGVVSSESSTNSLIPAYSEAGGIVGHLINSRIINCYNTGSITSITQKAFINETGAYSYAGGIVGNTTTSLTDSAGLISNCYNVGTITSISEKSPSEYADCVGGIIGRLEYTTVDNCYNIGDIKSYHYYDIDNNLHSSRNYPAYIGSIAGVGSAISHCYWNIESSQINDIIARTNSEKLYYNKREGLTALTKDEMQSNEFINTLNENAYESIWWQQDVKNVNNGYPIFSIYHPPLKIIIPENIYESTDLYNIQIFSAASQNSNTVDIEVNSNKDLDDVIVWIAIYNDDSTLSNIYSTSTDEKTHKHYIF